MTEDSLDYHVRHTQAVQVAPKPAPGCVPAMPLGNAAVAPVFVACLLVSRLRLPAILAAVQRRKDLPIR
jgi:hypothetical protein